MKLHLTSFNAFIAYRGWVPRNIEGGGAGTAEPKPKQPEHARAHPTCNPATSPARQQKKKKNPATTPAPAPVTLNWKNSGESI